MNADRVDTLIERAVVPSFSSLGPALRRRLYDWTPLENYSMQGKVVVLTGGTSGIGAAAAACYAQLGATLVIVARDPHKAQDTLDDLRRQTGSDERVQAVLGDLGEQDEVRRVAAELAARFPVIDVLAHNAGALFNTRRRASNGRDLSVELMVSSPFLLTGLLLPQLGYRAGSSSSQDTQPSSAEPAVQQRTSPGRVLTMSSGGMYTQGLSVEALEMPDAGYQGAKQYARAKRAQVILNELWALRVQPAQVVFHALHPGWVNTPGITEALPGFSRLLGPMGLLRKPALGADTLVWLSVDPSAAACTGRFWHDRAVRPIDMSKGTRQADTPAKRAALWQWCERHTGWVFPD